MEFDFQRNTGTGELLANFSMGQEILGFWFMEELGESAEKYEQLCQAITQLQNNELKQWRLSGKSLTLELDNEQARVFANELDNDEELELESSMSIYDGESEAFCGLEDFHMVLESWHYFVGDS